MRGPWAVSLAVILGLALGLGAFTFVYARGASYLVDDPAACANCHVMSPQYAGWSTSSHHAVAGCNDCHTPNGLVGKYATKAANGFLHSLAFTTGRFPEPLRIKPFNRRIAEASCRHCHAELAAALDGAAAGSSVAAGSEVACARCHGDVGHP